MAIFDDRKKQFEEQFRHEQDLRFRITARANRLFGEWAADLLGLSELEKERYAETVVHAQFAEPGVVAKVLGDLHANGFAATEAELRSRLAGFMRSARRQIMTA
ncbi:MAG: DUF1476 domain-containing protein [Stellaceae bacterium]